MTPCSQDESLSHYPGACLSYFQDKPTVLELGASNACVEVRGSERGRGASNFSGYPASVPEGSRACIKPTELCGRNSGFRSPTTGELDLSRETIRCSCVKEFCPQ